MIAHGACSSNSCRHPPPAHLPTFQGRPLSGTWQRERERETERERERERASASLRVHQLQDRRLVVGASVALTLHQKLKTLNLKLEHPLPQTKVPQVPRLRGNPIRTLVSALITWPSSRNCFMICLPRSWFRA